MTLAESLELNLPDVPAALVPPAEHRSLLELARGLAPIHRCGFEVRLGPSPAVDFQQGIGAREGERKTALAHAAASAAEQDWAGLSALLAGWDDRTSDLYHGIHDIWLEFDRPSAGPPAVFVGLARGLNPSIDRRLMAFDALDRLVGREAWGRFEGTVTRCFDACSGETHVSHLGLMLGRPSPFVRVNVRRLGPADLGRYLDAIGWPGQADGMKLLERLHPLSDYVTVCIDAGEEVQARLGFECHLDFQPPHERRWAQLLDELVALGWCTPEKRDALLGWPRLIGPADVAAWPADLVKESLRRPQDHFTTLDRRLSHVKVVYDPTRPTEAKGYFGYLPHWLRPPLEQPERGPANGVVRRRGGGVADATSAAADFLLAARSEAGWWWDFSGIVGATEDWSDAFNWSDEWVTAFVGTALASTGTGPGLGAARQAWDLLVERRLPIGGWGYNRRAPVDADSTSWGLRLAAAVGASNSTPARRARRALERYAQPDGGVTTYLDLEFPAPRPETLRPPNDSYAGWCLTSHTCVTAGAAPVAGEPARDYLRRAQRSDGSWSAYWWADDEYATALAAEALAAADPDRAAAAVRWALGRLGPDGSADGSPFATAWCIRILRLARDPEPLQRPVAWLLERQDPDGGWQASARLLAPRADVTDREASDVPAAESLDEGRTFTTATALAALAEWDG